MKGKSAISNLLKAGQQSEKSIKNIKSVAELGGLLDAQSEAAQELLNVESSGGEAELPKGIKALYRELPTKDTETLRISREAHQQLKALSFLTGRPLTQLATNIIDKFMVEHEEEISSLKNANMLFGSK